MSVEIYRASYQLESAEIIQTLYLSPDGDKCQSLQWLTATLTVLTEDVTVPIVGITVRFSALQQKNQVGVYVNVEKQHATALKQLELLEVFGGDNLARFAVDGMEAFDRFNSLPESMSITRLTNIHSATGDLELVSNFELFDFIPVLFTHDFNAQRPVVLQFNFEPVLQPEEVQRSAKKWVVQLDFETTIPRKTRTFLKHAIQANSDAKWLVDNLMAYSADDAEYVQQLLNDLYYKNIESFGFNDYPLVDDDLAEDLLLSCLPWSALDVCSAAQNVARRQHFNHFSDGIQSAITELNSKVNIACDSKLAGKFDVFISYSSRNFNQASAVCHGVEAQGIRCWMAPRDISPGQSYASAIMSAIAECKLFVLVYSDASNASQHVLREVERAVNQNKIIIPFRIEEAEMKPDLAYFISVCHWLDAVTPPLTNHVGTLIETLKKQLAN